MGYMDDSRMYKRLKRKEKHLYLVLDDWDEGFTIRKIDADSPDDHCRSLLDEPPVIRLLSPNPIHRMAFAALGSSHILAASNKHPATLVYDTDTAGLITGPPVPDALQDAYKIFLSVVFCSSGYTVPLIFAIHLWIVIRADAFVFFVSLKRHNI